MKKWLSLCLALLLAFSMLICAAAEGSYTPGTYTATEYGMMGDVTVTVTFDENSITSVVADGPRETAGIGTLALEQLPSLILEAGSTGVDAIAGATVTSTAILKAVDETIALARGDAAAATTDDYPTQADLIVVGAGASGLASASRAREIGQSVIVLEAAGRVGGAASLSAGNLTDINDELNQAAGRNDEALQKYLDYDVKNFEGEWAQDLLTLQDQIRTYLASDRTDRFDSIEMIMVDHYIGCSGKDLDGVSATLDYPLIRKAMDANVEIADWLFENGLTRKDSITNTHQITPLGGGTELINVENKIAEETGATILLNMRAVELIQEDGQVVGVIAENGDGKRITFRSENGVVLATGSFSGNAEMCAEYQNVAIGPSEKGSTTGPETNRGDGLVMASAIGAQLRDMQFIGFQANSYRNGPSKLEAQLTCAGKQFMVNENAVRFYRETNDKGSKNTKELYKPASNQPDAAFFFIGDKKMAEEMEADKPGIVEDLQKRGLLFVADTLEEAAVIAGLDADVLAETAEKHNSYVDAGYDPEFGRTEFNGKLEEAPYLIMQMQAAYHLTFGGLVTDLEARVLDTENEPIPGLYAAGDVTTGIEGATHWTGDCLTAAIFYGRVAAETALSDHP